jgi:hypothetical protein
MSLGAAVAIMSHIRERPLEVVYNEEPFGVMDEQEHIQVLSPTREVRHAWLPSFLFLLAPVFLYFALVFRRQRVSLGTVMLLVFAGATLAAIPSVTGLRGNEHYVHLYGGGFKMSDVDVEQELSVGKILSALPPRCWQILGITEVDLRIVDWREETPVKGRLRVWLAPKLSAEERMVVLRACAYALHEAASWVPASRAQRRAQRDIEMPFLFSAALGRPPRAIEWALARKELVTLRSHLNSRALTPLARQKLVASIRILEIKEEELFDLLERDR